MTNPEQTRLPRQDGRVVPDAQDYVHLNHGESADGLLEYFRDVSRHYGLATQLSEHEDVIELPPGTSPAHTGPLQLRSSYRGFSDKDVALRGVALEAYRQHRERLLPQADIGRAARPRTVEAASAELLKAIPDVGGIRGVETYALYTQQSDGTFPDRLKAASWLVVHHTHNLVAPGATPNEADAYGLPLNQNNSAAYPYRGHADTEKTYAFVDGLPLYEIRNRRGLAGFDTLFKLIHAEAQAMLTTNPTTKQT